MSIRRAWPLNKQDSVSMRLRNASIECYRRVLSRVIRFKWLLFLLSISHIWLGSPWANEDASPIVWFVFNGGRPVKYEKYSREKAATWIWSSSIIPSLKPKTWCVNPFGKSNFRLFRFSSWKIDKDQFYLMYFFLRISIWKTVPIVFFV